MDNLGKRVCTEYRRAGMRRPLLRHIACSSTRSSSLRSAGSDTLQESKRPNSLERKPSRQNHKCQINKRPLTQWRGSKWANSLQIKKLKRPQLWHSLRSCKQIQSLSKRKKVPWTPSGKLPSGIEDSYRMDLLSDVHWNQTINQMFWSLFRLKQRLF